MLEKQFKLKANGTDVKTEIIAGITTFMAMAYILAVNPAILGDSGMNKEAVLMATALSAFIGTICMAFLANYPFALAPGLGLNAYFAYTVCGQMGYSWQFALFAVFAEGLIFIVLSVTPVREAIFNAIPLQLKKGVSVGIGLFVAFIGLQNGKIVVYKESTLVTIVSFNKSFSTIGVWALLTIIGTFIIAILNTNKVKGSILIGIFATWILGIILELCHVYVPAPADGFYSTIPSSFTDFNFASLGQTFGACFSAQAFENFKVLDFVVVLFAFLFVDVFDTLGTLIGCADKADMLDKEGRLPRIRPALLADAIATSTGAVLGTSTTTTFVESSSGISAGGRTGLSSVVTGLLFLVALILSPLFISIPGFATAPALIFVGFLMMSAITGINFKEPTESIPAFLALLVMPLVYSISDGICIGVISYVVINLFTGNSKKIKPLMYVLAVLFIIKYIVL
ncbi:MAG: NCS2 family permease [Lachnospiraceae bacterium]|nr:NCS2 family permease [Lachnospiraceae bacterium]